jgi:divalent metal cation (Fe/Co/Zn/Cd) transporter
MKRAVRGLIRLVASGLILFGALEIGLELVRHRMKDVPVGVWSCVIGGVLIVLGIALFFISAKLAEQLTDDYDE